MNLCMNFILKGFLTCLFVILIFIEGQVSSLIPFFVKKNIVSTIIFYLKDAAPAPIFGIGESSGSPLDIIGSLLGFFNPFKLLNPLNLMGGLLGGGGLLG